LADVAQYYYINDLRPDFINEDKLTGTTTALISADGSPEADRALWQHMTTFGMGLGVSGTLGYSSDYTGTGSADFQQIRSGALGWPVWPNPNVDYTNPGAYNDPKSIDDFWHASVNGRGKFFSAGNPQGVIDGVKAMFKGIDSATGAGGGLSVSNNIPVIGDNAAYITAFTSVDWTGELTSKDIVNGVVGNSPTWTAKAQLDARIGAACDNRKIYYRSGAASTLANFTWNTKACDAAGLPTGTASTGLDAASQAYFDDTALSHLSQYPFMTTAATSSTTFADQKVLAVGANLVNFLRGQRGLEGAEGFAPGVANALYRNRKGALGDIVGSVAAVVKAPRAEYADAGYAAFVSSNTNRTTTIYVGSNAGMLHAFSAATGEEKWAYVPRAVIPELHRLADSSYDVNHRFYVDGSPVVGDVFKSGAWRTILVGGLNKGGKGYYALDITNPASPQSLWEFGQSSTCGSAGSTSDCDVGLSYGKPVITKLANGVWVVLVTSGYNNTTNGGSGNGVLYVLDAVTGAIINKLNTGAGDTTTPSGLREVNNYVANPRLDNTTLRVFGGDLLGNIWRFDINDTIAPSGKEATLVATAKDPSGTAQPITNRVQLAEVDGKTFIVAATGKLLSTADTTSAQVQSVYAFKDTPGAAVPVFTDLRAASTIEHLVLTRSGTGGTIAKSDASLCVITDGWYLDLPESRERVTVDPVILGSTLVFASNTPIEISDTSCQAGHSWLNAVGLTDCQGQLDDTGQASHFSFNQLSVGLTYLLPQENPPPPPPPVEGEPVPPVRNSVGCPPGQVKVVSTGDASGLDYTCVKVGSTNPLGRRISWREIFKK
jgi:Tfp pilus tip-associated adhesin PilY1